MLEKSRQMEELIRNGDFDGLAELYAEDVIFMLPGAPPIVGRESMYNGSWKHTKLW